MAKTLHFYLADIVSHYRSKDAKNGIGSNVRAKVSAHLGAWMVRVANLLPGQFSAVQISWLPAKSAQSLGDTDILVYVIPDLYRSIIWSTGGDVTRAELNPRLLGLTSVGTASAISEVYWDRMRTPKELAGSAFHEAAHNKSQQDNEMHLGKEGLLRAAPDYAADPTKENLEFFAKHVLNKVKQRPGLLPKFER